MCVRSRSRIIRDDAARPYPKADLCSLRSPQTNLFIGQPQPLVLKQPISEQVWLSRCRAATVIESLPGGLRSWAVLRTAVLLLAVLPLAGCGAGFVYLRADGQDLGSDPVLYQQFEKDSALCWGEMDTYSGSPAWGSGTHAGAGGVAVQVCMKEKGYLVVPADLAALKQQDLAAKAAEKAQREAAAAAPPPPPPPPVAPKQVAAKPKPKPKPKPQQVQSTAPPAPIWPTPTSPPPASVDLFRQSAAPTAATTSTGQRGPATP
jgi:hypothetical protein